MNFKTAKLESTKPCVWVLHNMPRSGGTLVSKCFGAMNSHVLLSEIHPDAQHALSFNVLRQAQQWHGLLPETDWRETNFVDAVTQIEQALRADAKQLILRDWSHVDYLGPPVTNEPSFKPALLDALRNHFDLKSIQLVRHPLDAWLSLRRLDLIKKHQIDLAQFLAAYRLYLRNTKADCRLVYEDFLQSPTEQLKFACDTVGLTFDPTYQDRWFTFDKITGDKSNQSSLRTAPTISLRPRRQCHDIDMAWLNEQDDYRYIVDAIYSSQDPCLKEQ